MGWVRALGAHSGDGVIAVFRNKSDAASADVQLPVMPEGKFSVHSVITNKDLGVFSKSDWARGVPVALGSSGPVEILQVTAVK